MTVARVRVLLSGCVVAVLVSGCAAEPDPAPAPAPAPAPTSPSASPSAQPPDPGYRPGPFQPAAYEAWQVEIPQDFPLSHDLHPHGSEFEQQVRPVRGEFCGVDAFPDSAEVDVSRDGVVGPEYADARELRLFPDDRASHRFLVAVARTAAACPEETRDGATRVHEVRPLETAEEAIRLVLTYRAAEGLPMLGATWWDVVRVGNAVLVTSTSGEYLAGETLGMGLREHARRVGPVVQAMCVFSASGCGG